LAKGGRHLVPATTRRPAQADAGLRLRALVFDRLLPALGGCSRLFLAPDGDLTRLPFEVLPDADGKLLIDRYAISYLNSGRDSLRFGAQSSRKPDEPLVLADPDFDLAAQEPVPAASAATPGIRSRDLDRGALRFDRLPGTRGEGEGVARLLGVRPWLAKEALEGRLKERCRSPRILHLATHGFFLQDQPPINDAVKHRDHDGWGRLSGPLPENPLLRSGLALAGANTWLAGGSPPEEAEDGLPDGRGCHRT